VTGTERATAAAQSKVEDARGIEPDFDPLDPEFSTNPYPTWSRLRRTAPVARGARWSFWALTKYADIKEVSRQPKRFTSSLGITVPTNPVSGRRAPLHFDPPEHPLYRRPLNAVFSDENVETLVPEICQIVRDLVTQLVEQGGGDVVAELTSPLTGAVFGLFIGITRDQALDLNAHSERFEWAQGHREATIAEEENLYLYKRCRELVAARREDPLDEQRDMISALLALRINGKRLDDEFIAGSLRQLLIAAHVAPTAVIASAIKHLALDHDLQSQLRNNPRLIPVANEEFLRLYTPNQGFARTAVEHACVHGQDIDGGEQVALVLTSANRDEDVFEHPDQFVLEREPNPHIAFGHGAHKCAGQAVARAEMLAAIGELLAATQSFELGAKQTPLLWPLYGPESLEVTVRAALD
jgi:cytochrome P450